MALLNDLRSKAGATRLSKKQKKRVRAALRKTTLAKPVSDRLMATALAEEMDLNRHLSKRVGGLNKALALFKEGN